MKTLTKQTIKDFAKCSESTASSLAYGSLLSDGKIYLNAGNNAKVTINWLTNKFALTFEMGNDAPRGGKNGDFAKISNNPQTWIDFKATIAAMDQAATDKANQIAIEKQAAIDAMIITEAEGLKFLTKIEGLSNKRARKVAHNFAANKLGFYSTGGMDKFFELKK